MGGGASTEAGGDDADKKQLEEIAKLEKANAGLNDQIKALQKTTGNKARKTMVDSGTEAKFQRPGNANRRVEVSAEIMGTKKYEKAEANKPADVKARISKHVVQSVLFQNMSDQERSDCVDAFYAVKAASGETVITQGDTGQNYYFVESGELEVLVKVAGSDPPVFTNQGKVEANFGVGELALMYNTPRAATIKAITDTSLWALDRVTYRAIIQHYKSERAKKYKDFLVEVPQLKSLSQAELTQLAEAMEEESYDKDDVIIRQGETGDYFYIIAEGEVTVTVDGEVKNQLKAGSFFGEKALLSEDTRAATCTAAQRTICLSINREHFVELLGALSDLIERGEMEMPDLDLTKNTMAAHSEHRAIEFCDLDIKSTLGCGAFGRVKLVTDKNSGNTYALKCQIKAEIVENNLQDHVLNERNVMLALDHTFILKLHNSYKDNRYIYFLLELAPGGELFTFLRKAGRFNEKASKFYASSVVTVFEQLHSKLIVYRDLKPENLILDDKGFLKVCDFGLAKVVTDRTWTLCGTPDYLAPEIILSKGHNKAVDYWALGILIYEMCAGFVPYYSDDPMEVYQLILAGDLKFPSHFSRACMDLVTKLLTQNQAKRIGMMKNGIKDIFKHKWFSGYDWKSLLAMTMTPPIQPVVKNKEDISNFDEYPDEDDSNVPICDEWDPQL